MKTKFVSINYGKDIVAAVLFTPKSHHFDRYPCIIVCHGAFELKENFFDFCRFLCAKKIGSIVIDMPGHGESSGERFHVNIEYWVKAIQATIDFIENQPEIDPARIGAFGFSSGGTAVLETAIIDPRLKALITLDATVKNYLNLFDTLSFKLINFAGKIKKKITGSDLRLNLTHLLKNAIAAHDETVNKNILSNPQTVASYASFPFPGAAQCAFVDTINRMDRIKIPTLVMHGKEDHIDPPQTAKIFFDRLTCVKELQLLENSGHCGYMDTQKTQVMELTADWANKHLSSK